MTHLLQNVTLLMVGLVVGGTALLQSPAPSQRPDETKPRVDQSAQPAARQKQPTAAEMSAKETVASALLRSLDDEEYELRSAAEAMPAEKYSWRPASGDYGGVYPGYGPKELRTFAEQVKHVACANFAFAAELDGKTPPPDCDKGGPSPAKTRDELIVYLRDSFKALRKSVSAITQKNMFDPIEGPYAGPTRAWASPILPFGTALTITASLCYTCGSTASCRRPAAPTRRS